MNAHDRSRRLIDLGVHQLIGLTADELTSHAADLLGDTDDTTLAVHPDWAPPSTLASLLRRGDRPGFVVEDMTDVDAFAPITGIEVPHRPLYAVQRTDRGDAMRNWSPAEALPALSAAGRSPLTLNEGICWLLQQPDQLERNRCAS